jgi:hypothetical protein
MHGCAHRASNVGLATARRVASRSQRGGYFLQTTRASSGVPRSPAAQGCSMARSSQHGPRCLLGSSRFICERRQYQANLGSAATSRAAHLPPGSGRAGHKVAPIQPANCHRTYMDVEHDVTRVFFNGGSQ